MGQQDRVVAEEEGRGEFVCGVCGESFDSRDALLKHMYEQGLVE